jgi:hypothetical protein
MRPLNHSSAGSYPGRMRKPEPEPDDRPPICPACGVTMGIVTGKRGGVRYVCLECGFSDSQSDS